MAKVADVETTVHPDQLAAAIMTLAQAMGANQEKLTDTLAMLQANQKPREVNFGDPDYQAQLRQHTKVLKVPAYQNGFEVNPSGFSDEVIDRMANLKPGKYLGGRVRVEIDDRGAVHFLYNNKTVEQRFANDRYFGDFPELVNKIWDEMHLSASA